MKRTVTLQAGDQTVQVAIQRHHWSRRLTLSVKAGGVVRLSVPPRTSWKVAEAFLIKSRGWIEKQLLDYPVQEHRVPSELERKRARQLIHYKLSQWQPIVIGSQMSEAPHLDGAHGTSEARNKLYGQYSARALQLVTKRSARNKDGSAAGSASGQAAVVRELRVRIGNQRSRWGSCSSRGTLSFNWRLIELPEHLVDYIVVHELAHLEEANHSPRFWAHVEAAVPAYKQARAELRRLSTATVG